MVEYLRQRRLARYEYDEKDWIPVSILSRVQQNMMDDKTITDGILDQEWDNFRILCSRKVLSAYEFQNCLFHPVRQFIHDQIQYFMTNKIQSIESICHLYDIHEFMQNMFSSLQSCYEFEQRYYNFRHKKVFDIDGIVSNALFQFQQNYYYDTVFESFCHLIERCLDEESEDLQYIQWFSKFYSSHDNEAFEDMYYDAFVMRMKEKIHSNHSLLEYINLYYDIYNHEINLIGQACQMSMTFLHVNVRHYLWTHFFEDRVFSPEDWYDMFTIQQNWKFMIDYFDYKNHDSSQWLEFFCEMIPRIVHNRSLDLVIEFGVSCVDYFHIYTLEMEFLRSAWHPLISPSFLENIWKMVFFSESTLSLHSTGRFLTNLTDQSVYSHLQYFLYRHYFQLDIHNVYHIVQTMFENSVQKAFALCNFINMNRMCHDENIMIVDDFKWCSHDDYGIMLEFPSEYFLQEITQSIVSFETRFKNIFGSSLKCCWKWSCARVTISSPNNNNVELDFIPFFFLSVWKTCRSNHLSSIFNLLKWPKQLFDKIIHYFVREFPCMRLINKNKEIEWIGIPDSSSAPKFIWKKDVLSDTKSSHSRQDVKLMLEAFVVFHTKKLDKILLSEMKDKIKNGNKFYHIQQMFSLKNWNDLIDEVMTSLQDKEFIRIEEDDVIYYNPS